MKIVVSWVNLNANADGHRIYRSATTIDAEALPEPVAEVSGKVTQWVDTNVKRGDKFFYRIGTFKGDDVALSTERECSALPDTGPGPAELIHGDYEAGYFGIVTAAELVSGPELKALTGHQLAAGSPSQTWAKVAHKGRIIFVPIGNSFGGGTWQQLYRDGLLLGEDSVGSEEQVTAGGIPEGVNQLKTFTKFGCTFKVRCLKGLPDKPVAWKGGINYNADDLEDSEFNQILVRLCAGSYDGKIGINIPGVRVQEMFVTWSNAGMVCPELMPPNAVSRSVLPYSVNTAMLTNAITWVGVTTPHTNFGSNATMIWRPILELIDN